MFVKRVILVLFCVLFCLNSIPVSAVSVSARSAIVISGDTGEVLFSKNPEIKMPMASTTKIMTALLLCEHGDFEREITVTKEMVAVEGSSMGLLTGDTVSLRSLLYGMLLASGNDAANTTAMVLGGSVDGFVKMMNDKAESLGLKNTQFKTPSGLDAQGHYTTAHDLALLAKAALQNEAFAQAASCEYETLYYGNPPYRRTLKNHNKLLGSFDGAVGVKTGFTKKSGRCLVSAAKRDGRFVIAVTLNAPDDWNDHKVLLEYGLNSLQVFDVNLEEINHLSVIGGREDYVSLIYEKKSFSLTSDKDLKVKISLPQFLYAPIDEGETVGKISYYSNGELIYESSVKTANQVLAESKKDFDSFESVLKYIFSKF